jgi:hypothetical protein
MPHDPDPIDHCPHCGGRLYPSHEQQLQSQRFWSTIAGLIFFGGLAATVFAWQYIG